MPGKQTVLVVDDDPRLRDLLCTVLAPLDCQVVPAGSGEAALTELLQRRVAVIVMDINMPGMDGFETAQLVRDTDELASTPIIFLTGETDHDGNLRRGYDLGAVDFLVKPVASQVLFAKVKALLELDQSFARLRREAEGLHELQLEAARTAEVRQRDELLFTRRRERLTNIFAEASIDLQSLEQSIVSELSDMFGGDCVLRLASPGHGWRESLSGAESRGASQRLSSWLGECLTGADRPAPYPDILVEELTARGERVGLVCVARVAGPPFSDIDSALLRGASSAAALAVANATLYRIQAEYAAVMQATGDAILALDTSGEVRSCNKAAVSLFGGGRDLIGCSLFDFVVGADRERLQEQLDFTVLSHREVSMEMSCTSTAGRGIDVLITLSPIGDSVDLSVAAVIHDLTDIKQAQKEITRLASHDPLTDLANRRELTKHLAEVIDAQDQDPRQDSGSVAVLYIDVNGFKVVNDTYGHDTGDELLVEVAARLRAAVGPDSLVCRVGGDEFVVVLERVASTADALADANRILSVARAGPVRCRNATITPSLSMGLSILGADARNSEDLLSQADLAMFEAKKNRVENCVAYTDMIGSRHNEQLHLRARISEAVQQSEFRMVYQPIVDSAAGRVFGIEALIRWHVGDHEISADDIVAMGETSKQMDELGQWVIQRCFDDYADLGRDDLQLHVNISPNQVIKAGFSDHLALAMRSTGISPEKVCLELAEKAFGGDPTSAYAVLHKVRNSGFSLAIDDFGVEYANMSNLINVPVSWLKIDRSFIADVHHNDRVQRLVRGQIALAAHMNLGLIAEGVELQEQADWLREAGCFLHQGFLYARPAEADELPALLNNVEVGHQAPGARKGATR